MVFLSNIYKNVDENGSAGAAKDFQLSRTNSENAATIGAQGGSLNFEKDRKLRYWKPIFLPLDADIVLFNFAR
ncbi:unnamed protein product [Gongylonema pulchrum]|uniref:Uncharacterized protein n=1 Tax=Gongylonema pulchrum TaxID=637853 RepID=A0A183D6T1_9BILA|nr:unnamed protein product [Gongylonema pulchrum]